MFGLKKQLAPVVEEARETFSDLKAILLTILAVTLVTAVAVLFG